MYKFSPGGLLQLQVAEGTVIIGYHGLEVGAGNQSRVE